MFSRAAGTIATSPRAGTIALRKDGVCSVLGRGVSVCVSRETASGGLVCFASHAHYTPILMSSYRLGVQHFAARKLLSSVRVSLVITVTSMK